MHRVLALVVVLASCSSQSGSPPPSTTEVGGSSTVPVAISSVTTEPAQLDAVTHLVWVSGRLPDGFGRVLREIPGVDAFTVVSAGIADLTVSYDAGGEVVDRAPEGFAYPLEIFAVDPATYAPFHPEVSAAIAGVARNEVVLGQTSARLRNIGPGATLGLRTGLDTAVLLTVAAVLPDAAVGGAEILTANGDEVAGDRLTPRYALVRGELTEAELEAALRARLGQEVPLQVKREGDTPLLRHADMVRSQAAIKERFGEFAYRDAGGGAIEVDPEWEEENIVEVDLPLLGTTRCHREFAALLERVAGQLEREDSADAIDSDSFLGCWNPRWIADRRGLSRHAWGAAADINFGKDLDGGPGSPVHPELLAAMSSAGITSGHRWVEADPGHFEWYGLDPP